MTFFTQVIRQYLLNKAFENIYLEGFKKFQPENSEKNQNQIAVSNKTKLIPMQSPVRNVNFDIWVKNVEKEKSWETALKIQYLLLNNVGFLTIQRDIKFLRIGITGEVMDWSRDNSNANVYLIQGDAIITDLNIKIQKKIS